MKHNLGFFFILLLLLTACKEDPAPTGVTLLPENDLIDVVKYNSSDVGSEIQNETYFSATKGELATELWLGTAGEYSSDIVLQWFNFGSPIGEEGTILEAYMTLHTTGTTFGGETGTIGFDVMEIADSMYIGDLTSLNINTVSVEPTPRGTYTGNDSLITVQLDTTMVREWMRRYTNNVNASASSGGKEPYGIKIVPKGMSNIVGFHAANSGSDYATLTLIMKYDDEDDVDTISGLSLRDTYIAKGPDYSAQPLTVHGGLSYRARLKFDVSAIPAGSIVNYVKLTLTRNTSEEHRNTFPTDSVLVYRALDAEKDTIGSSSAICRVIDEEQPDKYAAEGTINTATLILAVQNWVNDPTSNLGLILTKYSERSELDQMIFYGGDADPDNRPKLEVLYTTKPQ